MGQGTGGRGVGRLPAARDRGVFCIGESADAAVPADEQDRVPRSFLSAYFPIRSPYEKS